MPGKSNHIIGNIVIGVLILSFLGCAAAPAPILPRSGDIDLAQLLESIRIKEKLPSIAAAIIIDGNIHSTAAVGTRKVNTNNWVSVDDQFLIASCAKAYTATLSAILVEQGHLDWNTTLKEAFPLIGMRKEYEAITLLQLLSHRSGLPEWIDKLSAWWSDGESPEKKRLAYLKETMKQPLSDKPGNTIYYSNSGYIIAGALIEKVMGKSYEQLITEELFEPLSMTSAGFGPPVKSEPGCQPFGHYGIFRSPISSDFPEYMAPTAAIHVSIEDWAKFILVHLDVHKASKVGITGTSLKRLHTQPDSASWRKGAEERGYGIPSLNYAMGWYALTIESNETVLWHPGGNTGFIAQALVDLGAGNAILAVTNVRTSHRHLFRAMEQMKNHYAVIAHFPKLN
jgi:CubicO group peptidase (beta-lactamase class C family)